ncbi:hypothetical protein CsSME_00042211 [Camellia sinensis var. sinensis]
MLLTMKKTSYYNFIPTKAEEEEEEAHNLTATTNHHHRATRVVVEIRDVYPPPVFNPHNPFHIKKVLTPTEVTTARIALSFADTFDYVFRYWPVEAVKQVVVVGKRRCVLVWDVSDEKNPKSYINEDMFLERGSRSLDRECYVLGCKELVKECRLNGGDEIGMFWEIKTATFHFKVLYRAI